VQNIIDYLKMDVELAEWESLESMFKTDILQCSVRQLGFEAHTLRSSTVAEFYQRWKILKHLEEIGFRRWYWHFNSHCAYRHNGSFRSACYEMVYINTAFWKTTTKTTTNCNAVI